MIGSYIWELDGESFNNLGGSFTLLAPLYHWLEDLFRMEIENVGEGT